MHSDPPRLVLRFAVCTGIGLALAAAAILLVVRHFDTVQAERGATRRRACSRAPCCASRSRRPTSRGPEQPDAPSSTSLFAGRVLDEGVLLASLVAADGTVAYSTDHRLIGTRITAPEHATEARRGIVRGDVASVGDRKSLRTYAPVAVRGGTGVVVIHQDYEPIARAANATFLPVAGIFEAVLILLFLALVPILRRVTLRIRRQMEEIQRRADYDELTGLPNRTLFRRQVEAARARATWTRSVLLLDVDHFKEVNDALGHELGDELLRGVAERLAAALRGRDGRAARRRRVRRPAPARLGRARLRRSQLAIHEALEQPFELGGFSLEVAASVGIAVFGEHGEDADALLQHADVAMYVAKGAHAGTAVYDAEQDTNDAERLALAGELRRAIEREELVVHYQPKADLADRPDRRRRGARPLDPSRARASSRPTRSSASPSAPA